jgi:hypothetical protein
LAGALASVAACGGGSAAPQDNTRNLARTSDDAQTAIAGSAVAEAPAVRVTDASGAGVAGVAVSFSVTTGGGSIGSASAATDAGGNASAGSWTLGQTSGSNVVTASIAGPPQKSVTFTATGLPGPAARLLKMAGDGQIARKGQAVPVAPRVRVTDQFDNGFVKWVVLL